MADNVTVDNGTGTDYTVASDDDGVAQHQYVKVEFGADGTQTKVSAADPLPVNLADASAVVTVSGTVDVGSAIPAGTNNIGDVDVLTAPAADRTTDNVGVAHQTDAIMNDTTALTPKFKSVSVAASQTDSSVVAAVTSKKIRVLSLSHQCGGTATDATYESDGASDTRLHKVPAGANGGQILPFNPVGWFETLSGEALIVTTGAGSSTEITLTYVEV